MAEIGTLEEFEEQTKKFCSSNPEMIPISLDVGYGMHYVPSKKKPYFRLGEVRVPSEVLKDELCDDLGKIRNIKIRIFAFIPKEMLNERAIELLKPRGVQ